LRPRNEKSLSHDATAATEGDDENDSGEEAGEEEDEEDDFLARELEEEWG
jgi:RNA polymerase II subunit A-like phosphatase